MKQINVGMVGYGMSGRLFHAPIITAVPSLHLKTVFERRTTESQQRYPWVEVVNSMEALLADDDIDLIVITTPTHVHYEQARQALLAEKHVVVEKPFTTTSNEAQQLIELAQQKNRVLSVYQNRRWDGDFLTVRKLVEGELLGRLVDYECHYDRYRTTPRESGLWREENAPGSGVLFDLGSHLIDQALTLFGLPQEVTAQVEQQRAFGGTDDSFSVLLGYDGLRVTLRSSMLVRSEGPRFVLHGTKGSFIKHGLDPQEDGLKQGKTPSEAGWGVEAPLTWGHLNTELAGIHVDGRIETMPGNYRAYYQNVVDTLRGQIALAVTAQAGRDTIRVIELARQSSREKRTLPFSY